MNDNYQRRPAQVVDAVLRVFDLRAAALSPAAARLAERGMSPREIQLRLASTWLPADAMRRAIGWERRHSVVAGPR